MRNGIFTISLDFELYWGVRDRKTIAGYGQYISAVHSIVPRLLTLFLKYEIHCTWATVGMLFCSNKDELLQNIPETTPDYTNANLSPYPYIFSNNLEEKFHFAPHLIQLILQTPNQELSTHTFSHCYCLESGMSLKSFHEDIQMANRLFSKYNRPCESIIFPKNQFNEDILAICKTNNINIYRGFPPNWLYKSRSKNQETIFLRTLRFLDTYFNISRLSNNKPIHYPDGMINIPASAFLRPFNTKLAFLEWLKLNRIKNAMTRAAKNKSMYHLWWHPHNFGGNTDKNFLFLEEILKHYSRLQAKYGMHSLNMSELAKQNYRDT